MAKEKSKSNMTLVMSSINRKTKRVEPEEFKKIGGYVVTKLLSYRREMVFLCNEINKYGSVSNEATYRFFLEIAPKSKRWVGKVKWDVDPNLGLVIEYYNCNKAVANEYLKLLTPDDIEFIRKKCFKGGVINK